MKRLFCLLLSVGLLFGCNPEKRQLNEALEYAGENRAEPEIEPGH